MVWRWFQQKHLAICASRNPYKVRKENILDYMYSRGYLIQIDRLGKQTGFDRQRCCGRTSPIHHAIGWQILQGTYRAHASVTCGSDAEQRGPSKQAGWKTRGIANSAEQSAATSKSRNAWLHPRTGMSPASKKQQRPLVFAHSRRTLYPLLGPEEGQVREAPVMDTALRLPSRQTLPSCCATARQP